MECVVNVSEGRRPGLVAELAAAVGSALLDVHRDPDHGRSVITVAGDEAAVWTAVTALARMAVSALDLSRHHGVHPRMGVLDVVPWVDLAQPWAPATEESLATRDRFASWAADELGLPCFTYGPERSLPDVRRRAWRGLVPDTGQDRPHPTAGSVAVGARGVLIAYNLWLAEPDVAHARRVAAAIRRPGLRALGLGVGGRAQVSCNLVDPSGLGPAAAYDLVAARATVSGAELVGLLPEAVLVSIPKHRWPELDLAGDRTIEARIAGVAIP